MYQGRYEFSNLIYMQWGDHAALLLYPEEDCIKKFRVGFDFISSYLSTYLNGRKRKYCSIPVSAITKNSSQSSCHHVSEELK